MESQFLRSEMLIGESAMQKLKESRVAVFGLGGVGSYIAEALARAGVGTLDIVDNDIICESNLNRQLYALHSTMGKFKVDVAKERILDINPNIKVNTYKTFFLPETADEFDFSEYSYVADAIDTVTGKIELVLQAKRAGVPVISSMGTGNKLNPALLKISDIYKTSVCPLARVMRTELKKRGVKDLKVVYSEEKPIVPAINESENTNRRQTPGSMSFVPPAAGILIAREIVCDLIK